MKYKIEFDKVPADSEEASEQVYETLREFAHEMTYQDSKDVTVEKIPENGDRFDSDEVISILFDVLTEIEMQITDDRRDLEEKINSELDGLVKEGLKKRKSGMGDVLDIVRYWTGGVLSSSSRTKCCDAEVAYGFTKPFEKCFDCGATNPEKYKVDAKLEEVLNKVDWK